MYIIIILLFLIIISLKNKEHVGTVLAEVIRPIKLINAETAPI